MNANEILQGYRKATGSTTKISGTKLNGSANTILQGYRKAIAKPIVPITPTSTTKISGPVKITPNATKVSLTSLQNPKVPTQQPNLLQQAQKTATDIGNAVKKTIGNITVSLTKPKVTPAMKEALKPAVPSGPVKITPNAKKVDLSSLNTLDSNKISGQSAMVTPTVQNNVQKKTAPVVDKYLSTIETIKNQFPETRAALEEMKKNPLSLKDPKKTLSDTLDAVKQPLIQAIQRSIKAEITSRNPKASLSEKLSTKLLSYKSSADVLLSPIGALFKLGEGVPLLGTVIKATMLPFVATQDIAPKISNKLIDTLPLSSKDKATIKPAIAETFTLAAQFAVGAAIHNATAADRALIKKVGVDVFEKITKDMIEQSGSSKVINFTPTDIKDIFRGVSSKEMLKDFTSLGLTSDQIAKAARDGVSIQIPAEKIVRIVDKPYWGKIKGMFNIASTDKTVVSGGGANVERGGFVGLLGDGEHTPQEVIGKIIKNNLEKTPEGKDMMKTALEAQKTGQNMMIENNQPIIKPEDNKQQAEIKTSFKDNVESPKLTKAQEYVKSKKTKFRTSDQQENKPTVVKDKKDLFTLHNLSASGIDKAFEQGGIPAPSLAITKKNVPFSDFGDVTLVGDKNLTNPQNKDVHSFSGDIYTPRVPRAEYTPKPLYKTPLGDELTKRGIYFGDFDSITPEEALQRMTNKATTSISDKPYTEEQAKKIIKDIYSEPFITVKRKAIGPDLKNMVSSYPDLEKVIKESRNNTDFRLTVENEQKYNKSLQDLADKKFDGDVYQALDKIESDLFEQVPYTVENKVRKAKDIIGRNLDDIRGTEQGWGMGANPRIFGYDKFSSIGQIKGAKGNLMSKAKAEKIGTRNENNLFKYLNKNKMGLDYSNSISIFKDIVKDNKFDDASFIKKDLGQFGDFKDITLSQAKEIGRLMKIAYKNVPTDYFETKVMRPVKLGEFKGALVPEGTLQSTIDKLQKEGLKVVKYNGSEADRLQKLNENFKAELFRIKDDFKRVTGITINVKQEAEIIKLNKEIFGDEDIKITEQILANSNALGSYLNGMISIIDGQANLKDTFYHEIVHKYMDVFLSEQEHVDMLEEAAKIYGMDDFAKVEEKLAEDFIKYAKDKEGFIGKIKLLFDKLIQRIKKYFSNKKRIDELYNDILTSKKKPIPPRTIEETRSIMDKYNSLIEEGTKEIEAQVAKNQSIETQLAGLSSDTLRDISTLKRMAATKEGQEGDIETLYKKSPVLTGRVIEAIMVAKRDYENGGSMTDEEAIKIALDLPTRREIDVKANSKIKEANQMLKDVGIKLTEDYQSGIGQSEADFEKQFNEANQQLPGKVGEAKISDARAEKLYKNIDKLRSIENKEIQYKSRKTIPPPADNNIPPIKPGEAPSNTDAQTPVGTGDIKKSKAYTRVFDRLAEESRKDVNYNVLNLEQDTENALNFITDNPEAALRVGLGLEQPPLGQTETAISIALADKAGRDGDFELQSNLESSRSLRQTRRGQEIVSERGRFNDDSPHAFIKDLMDRRLKNLGSNLKGALLRAKGKVKSVKEAAMQQIDDQVAKIKEKIKKDRKKINLAQDIIDSLICK